MFYVYFIQSQRNNKIYVGKTNKDPKIRTKEHNTGSNTWSRQNGPFELVFYEKYHCEEDANAREKFYKTGFGKGIKYAIVKYLTSESSSDG